MRKCTKLIARGLVCCHFGSLAKFNHPQVMVENQIAYSELCSRKFFLKAPIKNEHVKKPQLWAN